MRELLSFKMTRFHSSVQQVQTLRLVLVIRVVNLFIAVVC